MTIEGLLRLILDTLRDPRDVARRLLVLNLDTSVLWLALVLVTVLNALLFHLSNVLFPAPSPAPGLTNNPMLYAIASGGAFVISIFVLTWVGNIMGGRGRLADVLVLMVWLQFVGLAGHVVMMLIVAALPPLALGLTMVIFGLSLWITLHFLSAAHHFDSLWRAFGVLVGTIVGLSVGLTIFLTLIGVSAQGVAN